eukprot:TRINITY_DN56764_c0_g1_i1.p1 TRINITY_DN56764_c0_g1~~TRINITY_DN56764_c0_g1_i1.p1  ORF type:complete len:256 (+),score=11.26 TRINITY_DN56764_c0_g1_i1:84-770(+)
MSAKPAARSGKPRAPGQEMKVVLVGAIAVGKTSTVHRFTKNTFHDYLDTTIGSSYMSKEVEIDGQRIKFSVWDTAGQEQYHSLVPMYFRQAAAVLLVFDITKKHSFEEAQEWVHEIKKSAPEDVIIALAGNKCDLEEEREVQQDEADDFSNELGAFYMETSAKTGQGIFELFESLGRKFLAKQQEVADDTPTVNNNKGGKSGKSTTVEPQLVGLSKEKPKKEKKGGCC